MQNDSNIYPYDYIAEKWHSEDRGFRAQNYVDLILEELLPGARVLDLGCGTGTPIAQYLIQRGFDVVGVDGSTKMLDIARQVVPEARQIHGDMVDVKLEERFAAAIVWDSMFHVDREHHQGIFRKLNACLEPDGMRSSTRSLPLPVLWLSSYTAADPN